MRKFIQFTPQFHWLLAGVIVVALSATFIHSASAQDEPIPAELTDQAEAVNGDNVPAEYVSIHVDGGAMRQVLNSFAMQANRNIVLGPEVTNDTVTIHLNNVKWDNALDVILKPYGYGYRQVGDAVVVGELSRLRALETIEPLQSRVYTLSYLNSGDVEGIIQGMLSPRGSHSVISAKGQKGWKDLGQRSSRRNQGAGGNLDMRTREEDEQVRSKTIVVTDVPGVLDSISETLAQIDQMPKQVLVEARFMEVNEEVLRDVGVELSGNFKLPNGTLIDLTEAFFNVEPNSFGQLSEDVTGKGSSTIPVNYAALPGSRKSALNTFGQLSTGGSTWDLFISLVEEDEDTKTLSAPKVLTLDNQEAAIVVGTRYPIISSTTTGGSESTRSEDLEYYESVGIQLNVVPQICSDGYINMIVRPSVTEIVGYTGINNYPIIKTRDTETQVLVENGETIVIGGLLEERESEGQLKVPFLGDIPIIGRLFRRDTTDTKTIDLLIFIKATAIDQDNYGIIAEQPEEEDVVVVEVMDVSADLSAVSLAEEEKVATVEEMIAELE